MSNDIASAIKNTLLIGLLVLILHLLVKHFIESNTVKIHIYAKDMSDGDDTNLINYEVPKHNEHFKVHEPDNSENYDGDNDDETETLKQYLMGVSSAKTTIDGFDNKNKENDDFQYGMNVPAFNSFENSVYSSFASFPSEQKHF